MKQTAVEWLLEKVWELDNENFTVPNRLLEAIEQAKDMEDNSLVCSGCLTKQPTVDRDMFDGLCADCTTKSLYDDDFEKRAKEINEQFKNK